MRISYLDASCRSWSEAQDVDVSCGDFLAVRWEELRTCEPIPIPAPAATGVLGIPRLGWKQRLDPTRDRSMISSGLFISQPWPLINIHGIVVVLDFSMSQDWKKPFGNRQESILKIGILYWFYFGILIMARTSSFFFLPKDWCPSNIFLISLLVFHVAPCVDPLSPLDHSSSLILERSEICKKFLYYQNMSKRQR